MTIAAIHDSWIDPASGEAIRSCAMVIGEPNELVRQVHDRMPVILEAKDFQQWERGDSKEAAALMVPAADGVVQRYAVSKRVNSSRAEPGDATLIDAVV